MCENCDSKTKACPTSITLLNQPRRMKLWEVEGQMHCSIVGTCLNRHDLNRIMRRAKLALAEEARDYDIHSYFVHAAGRSDLVGRMLHKALDDKHAVFVRRVRGLKDQGLWDYWRETCGSGRVAGGYWALLSWSHVPMALKVHIFGDVYMPSHIMVGHNRGDAHALMEAEARVDQLGRRLERVRRDRNEDLAARDRRIDDLDRDLREARVRSWHGRRR